MLITTPRLPSIKLICVSLNNRKEILLSLLLANMLHIRILPVLAQNNNTFVLPFPVLCCHWQKAAKKCVAEALGTTAPSGGLTSNLITRDRGEIQLHCELFCQTITLGCDLYWGRYRCYIIVSNCVVHYIAIILNYCCRPCPDTTAKSGLYIALHFSVI